MEKIDSISQIPKRNRVLVVEDNACLRRIAQLQLLKYVEEVDFAANGLEAIAATLEKHYDLILMDIHMPVMDGLTATKRIREAQRRDSQPTVIIAMTASDTKENCLEAGMDDFIPKPANYPELVSRWLGIDSALSDVV